MELETTWIDAWIRWDRNSKDIIDEDDFNENKETIPSPTNEFAYTFKLPAETKLNQLKVHGFSEKSEQCWNSTGLTIWKSSHYLCEYLLDNYIELFLSAEIPRKFRAIELGSGLGLAGLLLHHIMTAQTNVTSSHIYLTDGDTETLTQLRKNAIANSIQSEKQRGNSDVSCHQLLWGKDSAERFFARHFSKASFSDKHSNFNETVVDGVDFVFGSDLIYTPRVIGPLFDTVSTLLKNGNEVEHCQGVERGDDDNVDEDVDVDEEEFIKRAITKKNNTKPIFLMAHSDRREGNTVTLNMVVEGALSAGLKYEILQTIKQEGIYILAFKF